MTVVVVGGGLAGLVCARHLSRKGTEVHVLEQSSRVGGRLQTDEVDGFRLDHGFQVVFDAYPDFRTECDLPKLNLRRFEAGAQIALGGKLHGVYRDRPLAMAFSGLFSFSDKLKVIALNKAVTAKSDATIFAESEVSALEFLKQRGFSDSFLDRFARPFFGGIFLDRSLNVSSRMFQFVWRTLNEGNTVVPALGIAEIPKQLAEGLNVRLGVRVVAVRPGEVELSDGEIIRADHVVVATESDAAAKLTGLDLPRGYRSSTCLYFEATKPPVEEPILILRGDAAGIANEVVPVSVVAPETAPKGKHLVSATVLGLDVQSDDVLAEAVKRDVEAWLRGKGASGWRHLKTYRVRYAQMDQAPGVLAARPRHLTNLPGVWLAGEFTVHSSIQGAMQSGRRVAEEIMKS